MPLAIGVKGLVGLRRAAAGGSGARVGSGSRPRRSKAADRAVGRSLTAAALVTIGAGGDNLAVYIPLFRVGGTTNLAAIAAVFVLGEVAVTAAVLGGGRHPRARALMVRLGAVAVPVLLCAHRRARDGAGGDVLAALSVACGTCPPGPDRWAM